MNKPIDDVRAQETRDLKPKRKILILTHSNCRLLKRPANLIANQNINQAALLRYNLNSPRIYIAKEALQFLSQNASLFCAREFGDHHCKSDIPFRIEPIAKVGRILQSHRNLLLNFFLEKKTISSVFSGTPTTNSHSRPDNRMTSAHSELQIPSSTSPPARCVSRNVPTDFAAEPNIER